MEINKIMIKNFKSFGVGGVSLELKNDMNIFVGENNVGKSNFLKALKAIRSRFETGNSNFLSNKDWYNDNTIKLMQIHINIVLNNIELSDFTKTFFSEELWYSEDANKKIENFKKEIGNGLELIYDVHIDRKNNNAKKDNIYFKIGNLFLKDERVGLELDKLFTSQLIDWESIEKDYLENVNENIYEAIKRISSTALSNNVIYFRTNSPYEFLKRLFMENVKIFEDIRQKPVGSNAEVYESLEGVGVANVLLSLKNSDNDYNRYKYELIKNKFSEFFPLLEIEAVRNTKTKMPDIKVIKKATNYSVFLNSIGTGVIEFVIILTNIIASKNKIFCLEEPEIHMHPHNQRLLFELLEEYKENNQIVLITHSIHFVDKNNIDSHIFVRELSTGTSISQLQKNYFSDAEKNKLKNELDNDFKELFFSRRVLLAEGETEIGALPIFSKKMGRNLDKKSISIISVGSKTNFELFIKLLKGFSIPWILQCDRDAIMEVNKSIEDIETSTIINQLNNLKLLNNLDIIYIKQLKDSIEQVEDKKRYKNELFENLKEICKKYNCFVLSSDFEGVLKSAGFEELMEEAKKEVGKSKARQGMYIAERVEKEKIPIEFSDIIKKIYEG